MGAVRSLDKVEHHCPRPAPHHRRHLDEVLGAPRRHGIGEFRGAPAAVEIALHMHVLDLHVAGRPRSEEHTSELQSLMRISYAVFCLKKKNKKVKKTTRSYRRVE